jgi:hypothetical protein
MSSLGLVMIVKNEAHGIADTLATIAPYIGCWTILDTGSTDGTQALIRRELAGIEGQLHEDPFVDFSTSRNRALDLHGMKTPFTLMLDSDDRVHGGVDLRDYLDELANYDIPDPAYLIERRGDTSWWMPMVLWTPKRWRYSGRVHEAISGPHGEAASKRVDGVWVTQERSSRSAASSRHRWLRDLELLMQEDYYKPNVPRTVFYLAQTHQCLGQLDDALREYQRRVALGGWADETFEAMLRKAFVMRDLRHDWRAVQEALLAAHSFDPARAEPLWAIAEHYRLAGDLPLCLLYAERAADMPMPASGLFVDREIYDWKAADLVAVSAYYVCQKIKSERVRAQGFSAAYVALRERPNDPRLAANVAFYERLVL